MGAYAELPGVRTWYETDGPEDAEPLLLLHGGLCTNETWAAQRPDLAASHRLYLPERRAHGHTPDVDGPLSYGDMAEDTVDFLERVVRGPAHLVGWSDGGIVALLVALARPDLVRKVVAIGANFRPTPEILADPGMLDDMTAEGPFTAALRDMYAAVSPDGADHWPVVLGKLADMFAVEPALTPADLSRITAPTLVLVGDDDMMTLEHTIDLYRAIPASELAVVPGTSHAVPIEKPALVNTLVLDFLTKDPAPTMLPIRRAPVTRPQ
ncbi:MULTISPECIES: alpha/beta fold hydrolase [unclassified Streptomyces]|uniref:alpha/beta fold hydrolase n=1 Tax=unclassified Streptomyces TaxID=2593676 RepID=UPI00225C029C|nr:MULTISPECIES: alpha/beta hydrolase [unclassified Streptomyces]MCX5056349.1 alpha/beta hydrolase [Streptomyces sp. NBC_00452]MCX5287454.1 alpha/beta hydrolase [Streptomyces sp. NBC_00183]